MWRGYHGTYLTGDGPIRQGSDTVFGYPSHICFRFSDTSLDRGRIRLNFLCLCVTHLTLSWFQLADTPNLSIWRLPITKHILFILVGGKEWGKWCFFLG
jgi:hypothetical protein